MSKRAIVCLLVFLYIGKNRKKGGIRMKRCLQIQIAVSSLLCMFLLEMQIRTGILSPVKSGIIISTLMISLILLQLRDKSEYFFNASQIC